MGQKANPVGLRLGIVKDWNSIWFADSKTFAKKLLADIRVREYLKEELAQASISKVKIERPAENVKVTIYAARPGVIIGKKGEEVDRIKAVVSKITGVPAHINIEEVKKPELDAHLVAENIAQQLERRVMFRKAMKRAVQNAIKMGAEGIKICVSGRLGGAEIARSEWCREGRVPLHTLRADVDYAVGEALTTYGIIGVKVWIFRGEVLGDKRNEVQEEAHEKTTKKSAKVNNRKRGRGE
jgi:small subunit ribosomal protein S3